MVAGEDNAKKYGEIAFKLYPYLFNGEKLPLEQEKLGDRIKRIHSGLQPELEFFVVSSWLGNCIAINRIDQTPLPTSTTEKTIRAPDFILIANLKGKQLPLLVEIKTSDENKVIWSEPYFNSLKRFSEFLKLPLLIAWKSQKGWLLVDTAHFSKRVTAYHLTLEKALTENLMSVILRDILVVLKEEFSFVLDCSIAERVEIKAGDLLPQGEYTFKIESAGFYLGDQIQHKIDPEYQWLFLAAPDTSIVDYLGDNRVRIRHHQQPETMFPLFHAALAQLLMGFEAGNDIDWNEVLLRGPLPSSGGRYREMLEPGIKRGFIRYVFDQVPVTVPNFLE